MENIDITELNRKNKRKFILICVLTFLFVAFADMILIWTIVGDRKELSDINAKLLREQSLNSTCTYKRDSLEKEVRQLSIYKSLTKAMVHRDEATSLLIHKVGDLVYMKSDSSKVVISDIVIGGSKYEYYIKYKVLHKDQSTEEVLPELIY